MDQTVWNTMLEQWGRYFANAAPTFVSLWFVAFVFAGVLAYYVLPGRMRWVWLLALSVGFLCFAGWQAVYALLAVAFVSWYGGKRIAATEKSERKQRRLYLWSASVVLIGILAFFKLNLQFEWSTQWQGEYNWLVLPLGISYYTFSAISYMADIYRGRQEDEESFCKYFLFVAWFPKILQGPIERYNKLAPQLLEPHAFDYVQFCHGMQLALWGYMKKMIIADRIAPITALAFGPKADFGGCATAFALFLAAFQLYCDFSGCMDIAGGISQMLGIKQERNFNQPFFSQSAAEFWRRWHITLGTWFKDYVYMPLTVSRPVMGAAKWAREHMSRQASRKVMQVLPLVVVWLLTGLWHGTGADYLVWGMYWGALIIGGLLLDAPLAKLSARLRINTKAPTWRVVRAVRTFGLFCLGRLITIPSDLARSWELLCSFFTDARPWELLDGRLEAMGLVEGTARILTVGILVIIAVDLLHEHGVSIRTHIDSWNMVFRFALYIAAILCMLLFGAYGTGYDASAFIYAAF